jgi:hypothetical protein
MSYLRTIAVSAVVCACAVAATPALAKNFESSRIPNECSEASPCTTKGVGIGEVSEKFAERTARFKFGGFEILCKKVALKAKTVGEGAITWSTSQTFATEVKFNSCGTVAHFGSNAGELKTGFNGGKPVKFVYHVNGFAEEGSGETTTEVELGGATTTFTIAGKICKIGWPEQTVPAVAEKKPEAEYSSAVYSNTEVPVLETQLKKFPSGFQKRMIIANSFKGMKYVYEEGQCLGEGGFEEEFKGAEAKTGLFEGQFEEQVNGGNLSYNP